MNTLLLDTAAVQNVKAVDRDTIAVVMLNWNSFDDTAKCIKSLFTQPYRNLYLIVVDNASTNDEAVRLQAQFPHIEVLPQQMNLGFSRGVNVGLSRAFEIGASYAMLLNNDAWFDPSENTIDLLKKELDEQRDLGGVGPVVCEATPEQSIQSAGHLFNPWTSFPKRLMAGRPKNAPITITRPSFIVGACLLMRTDLLKRVGGLDKDFFLYSDDVDLALKMKALGYSQGLVPGAYIYHKKARATSMWSERHTYTMLRSHLIVVKKHARWFQLPTLMVGLFVITAGFMYYGLRNGQPKALRGAVRAWVDFFRKRWWGYDGRPLPDTPGCLRAVKSEIAR